MMAWTATQRCLGPLPPLPGVSRLGHWAVREMLLLPAATLQDKGFCLGLLLARFDCPAGDIGVPGYLLLAG